MTADATGIATPAPDFASSDELVLPGELATMERLPLWADAVGARHGLSGKTLFAARLCLEEAVSNSIRHGYRDQPGQVRIRFSNADPRGPVFTVEDDAAKFNPLDQPPLPAISPDLLTMGGQGIRLMRSFATWLEYEPTPSGNRLFIGFAPAQDVPTPGPASALPVV